jgi:ATP-dependent RNA helicase RhlE
LINDNNWHQVLVFSRTKHGANKITAQLEKVGLTAAAIHGNKSQGARTRALANFKNGKVQVLVATDIAARGLDIDQLPHVVNFDLPNVPEDYVHRIGRTGRAGATGQAVSLVSADEFKQLSDIERLIGQIIDRKMMEGFEPVNALPESNLSKRPPRIKKPKKPKVGHRDGQRSGENAGGHNAGNRARNSRRRSGGSERSGNR